MDTNVILGLVRIKTSFYEVLDIASHHNTAVLKNFRYLLKLLPFEVANFQEDNRDERGNTRNKSDQSYLVVNWAYVWTERISSSTWDLLYLHYHNEFLEMRIFLQSDFCIQASSV